MVFMAVKKMKTNNCEKRLLSKDYKSGIAYFNIAIRGHFIDSANLTNTNKNDSHAKTGQCLIQNNVYINTFIANIQCINDIE